MKMSMLQRLMIGSVAVVAILCGGMVASAAQDVFYSKVGRLSGYASTADSTIWAAVNPSVDGGKAYIWSSDDQDYDTSIGMNARNSDPNVVAFTDGSVYNPGIDPSAYDRWSGVSVAGGTSNPLPITATRIAAMNGANVGAPVSDPNDPNYPIIKDATGVLETNPDGTDLLHDPVANAFLLGCVKFDVVGSAGDTATLSLNQNDPNNPSDPSVDKFVHNGAIIAVNFGTATVNLIDLDVNGDASVNSLDLDAINADDPDGDYTGGTNRDDVEAWLAAFGSTNGDINLDGKVDGSDATLLALNWSIDPPPPPTPNWATGDLNGDGRVNGGDATLLALNWGGPDQLCGALPAALATVEIPEPASAVLALIAGLAIAMIGRRR